MPGATELFIIGGIVLLIFGGKKLPELMKGMGSGIKNFKEAVKEDEVVANNDTKKVEGSQETTTAETKPEEKAKQA